MAVNTINDHNASFGTFATPTAIPTTPAPGLKVAEFGLATPVGANHVELTGAIEVQFSSTATVTVTIQRDGTTIYSTDQTGIVTAPLLLDQTIAVHWEDVNPPAGYHAYDLFVISNAAGEATLIGQFSLSGTDYVPGT